MDERTQRINSVSGKIMLFLSLVSLLTVLTGYTQPPQQDEGTGRAYLSVINRAAGADGLALSRNSRLEPANAERAATRFVGRVCGTRICGTVLSRAFLVFETWAGRVSDAAWSEFCSRAYFHSLAQSMGPLVNLRCRISIRRALPFRRSTTADPAFPGRGTGGARLRQILGRASRGNPSD